MQLHIDYENAEPYALERTDITYNKENIALHEKLSKAKLKADKATGEIELDGITKLKGIPKLAWEYKLGNRSALEWVLDQYKEKKPSDPTIAEKFNTYRFADYKEQVIELLKRVAL
jgi:predicted helicase